MCVWPPSSLSVIGIPQCLVCVWNILTDLEALLKTHTRPSVRSLAARVVCGECVFVVRPQLLTQVWEQWGLQCWGGVRRCRFSLTDANEVSLPRERQASWGLAVRHRRPVFASLLLERTLHTAPGIPAVSTWEIRKKGLNAKPAQSSLTVSSFWFPYERPEVPWSVVDMTLACHSCKTSGMRSSLLLWCKQHKKLFTFTDTGL